MIAASSPSELMSSRPGSSSSPSSSSKAKGSRTRNSPGGGRQARGRGGGQSVCTNGPSLCVGETKNALTKLVREATGMPGGSSKPPKPSGKLSRGKSSNSKSPRSDVSSASGGNSSGSLTKHLRELFALGTFRPPSRGPDEVSVDSRPFRWEGAKLHEKWGDYDYDEELQEDLFLEEVFFPPVVNTFIHYRCPSQGEKDWLSSPGKLLEKSFHTKWPNHEEAHNKGVCKPCAYFVYKNDGCRWGNDCQFCHLCKRGEIKKRKKEKAKFLRDLREERRRAAKENGEAPCSDELVDDVSESDSDESQAIGSQESLKGV